MQVTNHSNNKRNMKEELLEAIYGTVERLEQKVDELSASPKNTEAEITPASVSVDTSKLEKAILAMAVKEGEAIDKLVRLREAICIFTDLTKKEVSKEEQRSKLLFDTINQVKQELNDTSPDFVIAYPKILRQRVLLFSDVLPSALFGYKPPCSKVA